MGVQFIKSDEKGVNFRAFGCFEAGNVPKILRQNKPQVRRLPTSLSLKLHISERSRNSKEIKKYDPPPEKI